MIYTYRGATAIMEREPEPRHTRIAAYLAKAMKNDDRESDGRSPPPNLATALWYVCSYLASGLILEGEGHQHFEPDEVEALMEHPESFRDSLEARLLREATRLYLEELEGASPSKRYFKTKFITGRDLDDVLSPATPPPRLALRPAKTEQQLTLYELTKGLAGPNMTDELESGGPHSGLKQFLRKAYLALPRLQRRVLKFRAIKKMAWKQVASKTGLSITSACRRYDRAVKALAVALELWAKLQEDDKLHPH